MIGNIDTLEDFLATGLCLRGGITSIAHGKDSKSFLIGHHLGFLLGFISARGGPGHPSPFGSANEAYASMIAHVKAEDSIPKDLK